MKYIFSLILFFISSVALADEITEAEVREAMSQMELAVKTQDVDKLSQYYSDALELNLKIFNGSSYQEMVFDKPKYIAYLKGSWNLIKNYTFRIDSDKIEIESDHAILTYEITESMAMGNQYFKVRSRGTTVFKKEKGRVLVTKGTARTI